MKFKLTLLDIRLRVVYTFILLVAIFIFATGWESYFSFDNSVILIQTFAWAVVFSLTTIFICFVVGLPIRINLKLKTWWRKNYLIAHVGIIIGSVFLIVSILPNFANGTIVESMEGGEYRTRTPNPFFATVGWILTAFMSLHFYLPTTWGKEIK